MHSVLRVFVCVCVCVCVYACVRVCARVHVCMRVCVHARMCLYVCMYILTVAPYQPFKYHKFKPIIDETVKATKDELIDMYREMQVVRKMEEAARELYMNKSIRGFCHLYIGQVHII